MKEKNKTATFTVWVTKYTLTQGIIEKEVEKTSIDGLLKTTDRWTMYLHKGDYSLNRKDAVKKAEELRIKKLQSLEKQIKKISVLKFD